VGLLNENSISNYRSLLLHPHARDRDPIRGLDAEDVPRQRTVALVPTESVIVPVVRRGVVRPSAAVFYMPYRTSAIGRGLARDDRLVVEWRNA